MRVTPRSVSDTAMQGLAAHLERFQKTQEMISTGKQINRPSDSPTGLVSSMQLRSDVARYTQWERNANDGLGFMATVDSTLSGVSTTLNRVNELLVQGMNTGVNGAAQRDAIAREIESLRDHLISQANTTYSGRPVFGGVTGGSVAYDPSGNYVGTSGTPVTRTVGPSATVRIDVTGPEVFGTGSDNLFASLTKIASDLRSNTADLSGDLTLLKKHMGQVTSALGDVGAKAKRLESMRDLAVTRQGDLGVQLSEVEDIDMAKTIMDLKLQEQAYQTALGATSKVIQNSLLDFLR